MLTWEAPYIKFDIETPKSPFGGIENLTKLTHDALPPYHRAHMIYSEKEEKATGSMFMILSNSVQIQEISH